MADGTSFEISIPVKAEGVGAAASAVEQLEARLKAAGQASTAAAEAVKAGAAAYASSEAAANKAAQAVEKIGVLAEAQRGKLAEAMEVGDTAGAAAASEALASLAARQDEAQAKAASAADAMRANATALDEMRANAEQAGLAEKALASDLANETKMAKEAAKANSGVGGKGSIKLNEMAESLGKMGGPAGMAGQKIAGLGNAFQKMAAMGPAAVFIAVGVALVAVVAGIAAAAIGLLKFGFASADAARTSMLLTAGIAGSVEGGKALEKTIGDLGNKVPMTTEELRNMASGLAKSGLKGAELSTALEEAAIKSAKLKFGPEYEKAMLGADFQSKKLKDNLGKVFGGLKTDGVMAGLQKVIALFDENSSSGKAMKVVFESVFQPIVNGIEAMIPKAIAGFLQFQIWALKGLIAIQQYQPIFNLVGSVIMAWMGGIVQSFQIAAMFISGMATTFMMFGSFGATALQFLSDTAIKVRTILQGISLNDIGAAMVKGLSDGITSGIAGVVNAVTGVASAAVNAAKSALKIKSPSRVFAEIGNYTSEGMAAGVDDGAAGVQSSMEAMVSPPSVGSAPAPGGDSGTASSSGAGPVYNIYVTASGDGDDIAAKVRDAIESLMASAAAQVGGSVSVGVST